MGSLNGRGRCLTRAVPASMLSGRMGTFGFQWHLTDRCNLRCRHCYQHGHSPRSERGLDDLRRMADRIFAALPGRRVSVNLTGGEPLVLPHLFDLIDHLTTFPNLEEVNLITNGTKVSERIVAELGDRPAIGTVKVSLEGADAATNDTIRGRGNLERVRRNLGALGATGKPVVLMVTLALYNLGQIEAMVGLARELGLAGVIFERFIPLGRGRELAAQVLSAREWGEASARIARAAGAEVEAGDLLAYRAFWLVLGSGGDDDELRGALCNLGDESMALMPDGTVYPCRRLPLPRGNLLDEPFEAILARLSELGIDAVRPKLRGQLCGVCGVGGCAGCRALALALLGDVLADDPQCPLLH